MSAHRMRTVFAAPFVLTLGCSKAEEPAPRLLVIDHEGEAACVVREVCPTAAPCKTAAPYEIACSWTPNEINMYAVTSDGTCFTRPKGCARRECFGDKAPCPPAAGELPAKSMSWTVVRKGDTCTFEPQAATSAGPKFASYDAPCPEGYEPPVVAVRRERNGLYKDPDAPNHQCEIDDGSTCEPGSTCNPPAPRRVACPQMTTISIDGELAGEHASISVLDRGLLYGDGLFEVLRTWDGKVVDLDAHLDRLYTSAQALQLAALERDKLVGAVHRTVAAAGLGEHRIRIVVTRGPGALAARLAELGRGRAIVIVEPLPEQPTEIAVAIVDLPLPRRIAGHKTLAYLDHVMARELARATGADEAVRLDAAGDVVECATANVFTVTAGQVATPLIDSGALPGITRGRVLACCAELAIPVVTRRISVDALRSAHEVFITSALRGVVAVTRLDGEARVAGPITQRLATAYGRMMRNK